MNVYCQRVTFRSSSTEAEKLECHLRNNRPHTSSRARVLRLPCGTRLSTESRLPLPPPPRNSLVKRRRITLPPFGVDVVLGFVAWSCITANFRARCGACRVSCEVRGLGRRVLSFLKEVKGITSGRTQAQHLGYCDGTAKSNR